MREKERVREREKPLLLLSRETDRPLRRVGPSETASAKTRFVRFFGSAIVAGERRGKSQSLEPPRARPGLCPSGPTPAGEPTEIPPADTLGKKKPKNTKIKIAQTLRERERDKYKVMRVREREEPVLCF